MVEYYAKERIRGSVRRRSSNGRRIWSLYQRKAEKSRTWRRRNPVERYRHSTWRNPDLPFGHREGAPQSPDIASLNKLALILQLTTEERELMYDLAGRERNEAAPDLPEYLMNENIPHVRAALRRANDKKLGDEFWRKVMEQIEQEGSNE